MNGFEIKINKEEVEKQIVKAVVDSSIGEHIQKAITELFKDSELNSYYKNNNIVRNAVKKEIESAFSKIVHQEMKNHENKIREFVKEQLTDELLKEISNKTWNYLLEKSGF